MKCAIVQPSYIPWRGYFDMIRKADVFVFYDDVQFDKRGWRNRNKIKTAHGLKWLTIPVKSHGHQKGIPIKDIQTCQDENWQENHWAILEQSYKKAPYFTHYAQLLQEFYRQPAPSLSTFTINLTMALCRELSITNTKFLLSSALQVTGNKTDRLLNIITAIGATHYISGPSAKAYLEEEKLAASQISLEYMTYNYTEYPQLYPPYDPQVSILDLLFMVGPDAPRIYLGAAVR